MRSVVVMAAALGSLLTCPGCVSQPETPDAGPRTTTSRPIACIATPLEPRIDAVPGRPILIPVRLDPPSTPFSADIPRVTLGDGSVIDAQLFWMSRAAATDARQSEPDPISAWLSEPPIWTARAPEQLVAGAQPPGVGFWALRIDSPASASTQALFIGETEAPLRWLSPRLPTQEPGRAGLFREPSPALERALANAARDPLNRWRVRLLDDRMRAPRRSVIDEHRQRFDHPAIETMAAQAEWRWRLALDRVSRADPFLGAELLDRLTAVARFDDAIEAPVWPTDDLALSALRTSLLDPFTGDEDARGLVREALRTIPDTTAWVVDDAGWLQADTGRTVTILGVAERAGMEGLARAIAPPSAQGPMAPLPAFGAARLPVSAPRYEHDASASRAGQYVATARVIGRRDTPLPLLPLGLPVGAPGFRLGPGFLPWTLEQWTAMTPASAPDKLAFYALLHRRGGADGAWQLHIECPTTAGEDPGMLRVHLGPSNSPTAVLRIDPAGLQQDQLNTPLERDPVAIARAEGAWVATIDIPRGAIERDGTLRLAIERYDTTGARATWPRPVMPWQQTPGRAALDLSAWNGLSAEEGW